MVHFERTDMGRGTIWLFKQKRNLGVACQNNVNADTLWKRE
jgi:hypothetical protein